MPEINIDNDKLFEPMTLVINGHKFVVSEITSKTLEDVNNVAKDNKDSNLPIRQLAIFSGQNIDKVLGFNLDVRKVNKALELIHESVLGSFKKSSGELKNV
jgi:hypothetical protein